MIKFLDIKKINLQYQQDIENRLLSTFRSGWYILGNEVKTFEKELANYLDTNFVIGTGNGLDALKIILKAYMKLGIFNEGDEVIVPANTFIASFLAISQSGLKPVPVEPDPLTFNLNISEIEKQITSKTKAIMPVHLYGRICFSEELKELAKSYNLKIIEDNAQAIGAIYNTKRSGNLGDAAAFSFYPGKNLGALGDAGAISTNDEELADMVRMLSNYGSQKKYEHQVKGYNSRLDELQASALSVKLKDIDNQNYRRQQIAEKYNNEINNSAIILPKIPVNKEEHVWHLYVVRSNKREELQLYLKENEIQSLIHYPIPAHKQKAYKEMNIMSFPITETLSKEVLSLPISPVMENADIEKVINVINRF